MKKFMVVILASILVLNLRAITPEEAGKTCVDLCSEEKMGTKEECTGICALVLEELGVDLVKQLDAEGVKKLFVFTLRMSSLGEERERGEEIPEEEDLTSRTKKEISN